MKTGKEIPESSRLEFWEKFLANNFALSDAEDSTSGPSNRGVIADLPLLRTLLAVHQKFLGRDGLFCFSSTWKFSSFKNPFAMITSLSELYFRFRRFILLLQMEKMISMSYGSSCCWKPWRWVSFELILTMRDICINSNLDSLTKFTSSSGNTQFKAILPWNISEMITKTIPISSRIVNLCNEMKHPVLSLLESHQKLRQHIRISQWTEPHCRINT